MQNGAAFARELPSTVVETRVKGPCPSLDRVTEQGTPVSWSHSPKFPLQLAGLWRLHLQTKGRACSPALAVSGAAVERLLYPTLGSPLLPASCRVGFNLNCSPQRGPIREEASGEAEGESSEGRRPWGRLARPPPPSLRLNASPRDASWIPAVPAMGAEIRSRWQRAWQPTG